MKNKPWIREEEILALNLYHKIPFQQVSKNHPDVIRVASLIGRSPSAVNMKIGNLASLDENLAKQGVIGLSHTSNLDTQIWEEFKNRWDKLRLESEKIIASMQNSTTTS